MRINRFVAYATGMSRRAADKVVEEGRVRLNGRPAQLHDQVEATDSVTLNGHTLSIPEQTLTIQLNKPAGYVCSRNGQGNKTIYELLPESYAALKPIGRLDKDSSGLILLTNDGELANTLTHPSFNKQKTYVITLNTALAPEHRAQISGPGVKLDDGASSFAVEPLGGQTTWRIRMHEGRNRQIRRTFQALGYTVTRLHRVQFGPYQLEGLKEGAHQIVASLTRHG